ncbi:hypothetical protein KR009_004339, partial [Drosophila setifemur]
CKLMIPFSSLLVVLGCLAWTCHAQDDFSVRANQIVRFFASDSITKQTKEHHVDTLVRFYQKYRNRIQLTPQQRAQADQYVQRYYQEKSQVVMVDGVPRQGGFFTSLITSLIVDLGIELSSAVFSRITS